MTAADLYAEQAAADAELGGELFTADDEFPPGPGVSKRRRTRRTRIRNCISDIADYQPRSTQ